MRRIPGPPSALALAALALGGCYARQPLAVPTSELTTQIADGRPVRYTLADGRVVTLSGARVFGDSIVGDLGVPPTRTALALADVRAVDERRIDVGRSAALGAGVGVSVALAAALAAMLIVLSLWSRAF